MEMAWNFILAQVYEPCRKLFRFVTNICQYDIAANKIFIHNDKRK